MVRIVKIPTFNERYRLMETVERFGDTRYYPHLVICSASRLRPLGSEGCGCLRHLKAREVVEIEKSRNERAERNSPRRE